MNRQIYIATISLFFILISCSTNKELIEKRKTEYGISKYYFEKGLKNSNYRERLLVVIDNTVYYSLYSDKIVKQTKKDNQLINTLFFDKIPENLNGTKYYQNLTKMDSIILTESNKILDSLNLPNFKKWNGAKAFIIEVNYYNGYPKNKKLKPY